MKHPNPSLFLIGVGLLIPTLASRAVRSAIAKAYTSATDKVPPKNPANPDVAIKDAVAWTLVTGAAGGLARLCARRYLANTQVPAEGHDMPEAIDV